MDQRNKVLNEIIANMPKGLTELQKVRYLYIEVCRFFVYNPEYITGSGEKKKEIFNQDVNIDEITNNKGICSSISRALMYLLERCNIQCNGVYFMGRFEGHMEIAVKIDGKVYQLDPSKDLMNVKMGCKTTGFANDIRALYGDRVSGYSYLEDAEIMEIDNIIGYTYGLSKEYVNDSSHNKSIAENLKDKIYMDKSVEMISDELYNLDTYGEYIKSMYPDINIDTLSAQDLDKYRIEFLKNYVNSYAKDLSYIEKRDFFECLVARAIVCQEGNPKLFRGMDKHGEMMAIVKYEGSIQEEDLYYLVRGEHDIVALKENQVQELIDNGFRTISKGKEQNIIRHNKNFQKATFYVGREINQYIKCCSSEEEKNKRASIVQSYILLQSCNEAIASYNELLYKLKPRNPSCNKMIRQLYTICMTNIFKHGYDKYILPEDIESDEIGVANFFKIMQTIKSTLEKEAEPIIKIVDEYKKALKEEAKNKGIALYHISTISPDKLQDGALKPMQNGSVLCASTESIESNIYLMSKVNGKRMYRLPIEKDAYLLEGSNVKIIKNTSGKTMAISSIPGYIYYVPIDNFEPVVHLRFCMYKDEYVMEFENEWISQKSMEIPNYVEEKIGRKGETKKCPKDADSMQVYAIEQYTDVTSVLEHNQVLVNRGLEKSDMQYIVNSCYGSSNIRNVVLENIKNGKLDYLNGRAKINRMRSKSIGQYGPKILYNGEQIVDGQSIKTPQEVQEQKSRLYEFVQNAIKKGVTYGDYMQIAMQQKAEKENVDIDEQIIKCI